MIEADKAITLFFNRLHFPFWDCFFFNLTHTQVWIVALLCVVAGYCIKVKREGVQGKNLILYPLTFILCIGLAVLLSDQITSSLIKPLVGRLRPSHALEQILLVRDYHGGKYGFPSSHAANCVAVAIVGSYYFYNRYFTATISLWAALMIYSRLYLGVHYFGDLLVGGLIGAAIAVVLCYTFARLQKIEHRTKTPLSLPLYLSAGGIVLTLIFLIISAFAQTYYF